MVKFVWLFRYPEGVSVEEGDKWYLGVHAQQGKVAPGLKKYLTWKVLDVPERPTQFARVTELWWDDLDSWRKGSLQEMKKLQRAAPWGRVGFEGSGLVAEPVCVNVEPEYDLLKEVPRV